MQEEHEHGWTLKCCIFVLDDMYVKIVRIKRRNHLKFRFFSKTVLENKGPSFFNGLVQVFLNKFHLVVGKFE